jgi:DNA ligase-associated metallophosphoesterase
LNDEVVTIELMFRHARFLLDPRKALWWPDRQVLAIADMHLDKGRALAQEGNPVPPYDTKETLSRLHELIQTYRPRTVLSLGDSFHNLHVSQTLQDEETGMLKQLMGMVKEWRWITGNHDPVETLPFGGDIAPFVTENKINFMHGDGYIPVKPVVIGHYHPKAKVRTKGRVFSGPCFAWNNDRLILPSFGAYTGGLSISHPDMEVILGDKAEFALIVGKTVARFNRSPPL